MLGFKENDFGWMKYLLKFIFVWNSCWVIVVIVIVLLVFIVFVIIVNGLFYGINLFVGGFEFEVNVILRVGLKVMILFIDIDVYCKVLLLNFILSWMFFVKVGINWIVFNGRNFLIGIFKWSLKLNDFFVVIGLLIICFVLYVFEWFYIFLCWVFEKIFIFFICLVVCEFEVIYVFFFVLFWEYMIWLFVRIWYLVIV